MPVAYRSHSLRTEGANGDANGATGACPKPTGVVAGDLLVALVARSQTSAATTAFTSPDWTAAAFFAGSASPERPPIAVLWKVAGASEPTSYTFTSVGASALDQFSIHMYALTGADTTTPFGAGPAVTDASGSSRTFVAPSVSPATPGLLLCWYGGMHYLEQGTGHSFSTPTGMTTRVSNQDPGVWLQCGSFTQSRSAGATGTRSSSLSGGSGNPSGLPRGISFVIREGITAVPPTVDAGADAIVRAGDVFTRIATEQDGGAPITDRAWTIVGIT